jgi:hypothetical protein
MLRTYNNMQSASISDRPDHVREQLKKEVWVPRCAGANGGAGGRQNGTYRQRIG